ncbi:MAG: hypothetical protein ABS76_33130 [Pelagibacterium sp. SCN 64-44]|nr:MAG: hypothetical protein ABS76_33130 [Pelagibacterium sp. SCN 64-44]
MLYYDCFRSGPDVLLIGPPPYGLVSALHKATMTGLPGNISLASSSYRSESVMITRLVDVPSDVAAIRIALKSGETFTLNVQPSSVAEFSGARLLFTMSKDNELAWISEWARYHSRVHGTDAVVFFDNGSQRYTLAEIAATIAAQGISRVAIHSWPYIYGAPDPAVRLNPFYTQFLQVASMSVMLRRYGLNSAGILNCDIDELAATPRDSSIYDLVQKSPQGLIVMQGRYMEPVPNSDAVPFGDHRDYIRYLADPTLSTSRPKKWALDPSRHWVQNLKVHPYMHWIENRPFFSKTTPEGVFYRHFRAINTNWKDRRTENLPETGQALIVDQDYIETLRRA